MKKETPKDTSSEAGFYLILENLLKAAPREIKKSYQGYHQHQDPEPPQHYRPVSPPSSLGRGHLGRGCKDDD